MTGAEICLATALYFEARSEGITGQLYVANTILNRVESPMFPNNVCDVIKQHHQFEFFWDGKPERPTDKKAWEQARWVADWMLDGSNQYHEGCHYHTVDVSPYWGRKFDESFTYRRHVFYEGDC